MLPFMEANFQNPRDRVRERELLLRRATLPCPANSGAPSGSRQLSDCVCTPGMRMEADVCVACDEHNICRDGNVTTCSPGAFVRNFVCVCAAGSFCAGGNLSCTDDECLPCPSNTWCAHNVARACSANAVAPPNSSEFDHCKCLPGFYRAQGQCLMCPLHHVCFNDTRRAVADFDPGLRTLAQGTSDLDLAVCAPGMFRTALTDLCKPCPRNFYCPQVGVQLPNVVRCYENEFTYSTGAQSQTDCLCQAGFKMTVTGHTTRCLSCSESERCQECYVVEELCHLQNKAPSALHNACVRQRGFGMYNFQCRQCSPGCVKPEPGDAPCTACPDGSYAANSTTCVACPDQATAREGSAACLCPPPYIGASGVCSSFCTLCPEATFGKLPHVTHVLYWHTACRVLTCRQELLLVSVPDRFKRRTHQPLCQNGFGNSDQCKRDIGPGNTGPGWRLGSGCGCHTDRSRPFRLAVLRAGSAAAWPVRTASRSRSTTYVHSGYISILPFFGTTLYGLPFSPHLVHSSTSSPHADSAYRESYCASTRAGMTRVYCERKRGNAPSDPSTDVDARGGPESVV